MEQDRKRQLGNQELAKFMAGNISDALSRAASSSKGDEKEGALARGIVFEVAGDKTRAMMEYCEAAEASDDLEALARLVIVQLQAGEFEEALANAIKLAAADPGFTVTSLAYGENYSPFTLLGDALFMNERTDDAIKAYSNAIGINEGDEYSSGRLAHIYLAIGDAESAIQAGARIQNNPRFSDLADTLALVERNSIIPGVTVVDAMNFVASNSAGRPLVVDGAEVRAELKLPPTGVQSKEALKWADMALSEYAAVASFGKFALELMSIGAPRHLIENTVNGMKDEIRHTDMALDMCSELSQDKVGIGEMDMSGVLKKAPKIRAMVRDCIFEACVVETISLYQAKAAYAQAKSEKVRATLEEIVADEMKHADLAWDFVEWAVITYPELADEMEYVEKAYSEFVSRFNVADTESDLESGLGILSLEERVKVAQQVYEDVIQARARQILAKLDASSGTRGPETEEDKQEELLARLLAA